MVGLTIGAAAAMTYHKAVGSNLPAVILLTPQRSWCPHMFYEGLSRCTSETGFLAEGE